MISLLQIVHDTMVDGPGFRTSIYCAGCENQCPGCHNPQSWDIHRGTPTTTEQIMAEIESDPFANVTFTGGDPMFQPEGFRELAEAFEQLIRNEAQLSLLRLLDVLVDGRYVEALRDTDLPFRGSSNQRILDVKKSLEKGEAVPYSLGL